MPFRNCHASFDPETLAALQTAFDRSWGELQVEDVEPTNATSARKALAERLIAYARKGHTDPAQLQKLAMRSLLRPIRGNGRLSARPAAVNVRNGRSIPE